MSTGNEVGPVGAARMRPEAVGDVRSLPYHPPELREYGGLTDLTLGSGGEGSPEDSPTPYQGDPTPPIS